MDAETYEATLASARAVEKYDPDGARALYAHLASVKKARKEAGLSPLTGYKPMRLYAQAAYYFKWSHTEIAGMDFRLFRGYIRELQDILKRENQTEGQKPQWGPMEAQQLRQVALRPQVYEGSVVRLDR